MPEPTSVVPSPVLLAPDRRSNNKVLLITEWIQTQEVFQDLGHRVHVLHPSMLMHGSGTNAQDLLRRGHDFVLVWIDLPSKRTLDTHRASAVRRWGIVKQIVESHSDVNSCSHLRPRRQSLEH